MASWLSSQVMTIIRKSKMAAGRHLGFEFWHFLSPDRIPYVTSYQPAKFGVSSSNGSEVMTIFRKSKMAAGRHLGLEFGQF